MALPSLVVREAKKSIYLQRLHSFLLIFALSAIASTVTINVSILNSVQDKFLDAIDGPSDPLIELLRYGDIKLTRSELEAFPKWEEVVAKFGKKPRILGLETCKDYRKAVAKEGRHVAPAGAFNSGTHLLYYLLEMNCYVNDNIYTMSHRGIDFQVNWGKHQSPRFRFNNTVKEFKNNSAFLPVVMVRDPWTWFQSMCRQNYAALWFHVPGPEGHCPNFIPNQVENEWFRKTRKEVAEFFESDLHKVRNVILKGGYQPGNKTVPIIVRYKNEIAKHESLAHFWKEWYQEYFDADFPRLMIRLEDVVFHPYETLKAVCDCAGGTMAPKADFVLQGENAKPSEDKAHSKARKTDLAVAFLDHLRSNRTKGMSLDDMEFARKILNSSVVRQYFGYEPPQNGS